MDEDCAPFALSTLTACIHEQAYFDNANISAPEVRRGLNSVFANDLVPDVAILTSALRAARRTNDFATCVFVNLQ